MTNGVRGALGAANLNPGQDPGLGIVWFAGGGGSSEGLREAGFDPDYALNHNGTAATLMVGNSVPPPLARALAAANLTDGEPMRAAA